MLEVERLEAGYDGAQVLFGVDLKVGAGEALAVLGRNGMGKTTTVRALFGLLRPSAGRVVFEGEDLTGRPPYVIGQRGLSLVPEGRQVFPTLTVEENLVATAAARFGAPRWTLPTVYDLLPRLAERRHNLGSQLSGGEQQMLAIGRALMTNPKLLVLDEATEGLAPLIRAEIWACLAHLKAEGEAIVVIDKNVEALTRLADRHLVIEKGRVAWSGTGAELSADESVKERYLHVGTGAEPVPGRPVAERPVLAVTSGNNMRTERTDAMMMSPIVAKVGLSMPPGITKAGEGFDHIAWNILGQTYVPKQISESSFSWHATFPPETFVPPHIHPTQDEFIYMLEGQFELMLDGKTVVANAGDLVRMPMGLPHGIFNKSGYAVKCLFWVSPTRRLYDLFWAIHNMAEQTPAEVVALSAKHEVDFLPPPEEPN